MQSHPIKFLDARGWQPSCSAPRSRRRQRVRSRPPAQDPIKPGRCGIRRRRFRFLELPLSGHTINAGCGRSSGVSRRRRRPHGPLPCRVVLPLHRPARSRSEACRCEGAAGFGEFGQDMPGDLFDVFGRFGIGRAHQQGGLMAYAFLDLGV